MPSINMIATRRAERKRLARQIRITAMVLLGELVAVLAILSFVTARIHAANRTIGRLDVELTKILPTVEKIKYYEQETKKLEPNVNLLADSRERTLLWCAVMQNLGRSVPEKTWLTSIDSVRSAPTATAASSEQAEAPKVTVKLRGTSINQRLVGETMLRLNQFPEFERVDLNYTQNGRSQEPDTIDFEVAALLKSVNGMEGGGRSHASN